LHKSLPEWDIILGFPVHDFYENSTFSGASPGTYRINVAYRLPNGVQTSSGTISIDY